jgi:hypothetical protein
MGDCGASVVEMISLGIGWVPVWEVYAQAFTSLHFGTSVAATKTGRSVVSTDRAAAHLLQADRDGLDLFTVAAVREAITR